MKYIQLRENYIMLFEFCQALCRKIHKHVFHQFSYFICLSICFARVAETRGLRPASCLQEVRSVVYCLLFTNMSNSGECAGEAAILAEMSAYQTPRRGKQKATLRQQSG